MTVSSHNLYDKTPLGGSPCPSTPRQGLLLPQPHMELLLTLMCPLVKLRMRTKSHLSSYSWCMTNTQYEFEKSGWGKTFINKLMTSNETFMKGFGKYKVRSKSWVTAKMSNNQCCVGTDQSEWIAAVSDWRGWRVSQLNVKCQLELVLAVHVRLQPSFWSGSTAQELCNLWQGGHFSKLQYTHL